MVQIKLTLNKTIRTMQQHPRKKSCVLKISFKTFKDEKLNGFNVYLLHNNIVNSITSLSTEDSVKGTWELI